MRVASRQEQADLVVTNCNVLSVHTMTFHHTNLLIAEGRIAAWDRAVEKGKEVIDARGSYAVPGLIDAHTHVEAAMLTVEALARLLVPRGVTTLMADLHEIGNVLGGAGVEVLAEGANRVPLRLFLQIPAALDPEEATRLLRRPDAVSFGEASLPRIVRDPDKFTRMFAEAHAQGRLVSGHAAGLGAGPWLSALAALGHADDHECVDIEQAKSRLLVGQRVMIREGSAARNLQSLVPLVREHPEWADLFMFCTDDRTVGDILERGHMDDCLRSAIRYGLMPATALRMATLNCAVHHRLDTHVGSLAPGRLADVLLLDDLEAFLPEMVIVGGEVVARSGEPDWEAPPEVSFPEAYLNTVHLGRSLEEGGLRLPLPDGEVSVRILRMVPHQILKYIDEETVTVRDGRIHEGQDRDILKILVIERHKGTKQIGIGLVRGFGLRRGALASTVAHDDHNLVVIGVTDADILLAVKSIEEMQGGLVVVDQGEVTARVALPLAGLISLKGGPDLAGELQAAERAARDLGCLLPAPFMALSFVPLVGIPKAGLSEFGLVDAVTYEKLPLRIGRSTDIFTAADP